ncbi:MAG: helix-turn-helix domain-containing protein [Desulfobulbus sp.]|nr:helix-turn-helix domain-containing protein [Desulfobulbus sp.]
MIVVTEGVPGEGMTHRPQNNSRFQDRSHQIRKELKLTQTAMAEKLDVSLSTIQRYENGAVSPDAEVLDRLAPLGVDLHWLITGLPFYRSCSHDRPGAVLFAFRSGQFNEIESLLEEKGVPLYALHQIMENHLLGIIYSLKYLNEKPF